jgi:hypothetical protein
MSSIQQEPAFSKPVRDCGLPLVPQRKGRFDSLNGILCVKLHSPDKFIFAFPLAT